MKLLRCMIMLFGQTQNLHQHIQQRVVLQKQGKFDEAGTMYNSAMQINPNIAENYHNKGKKQQIYLSGNAFQNKGQLMIFTIVLLAKQCKNISQQRLFKIKEILNKHLLIYYV